MFSFCFDCIQEYLNAPSWVTLAFQIWTAIIATAAFFVAKFNLDGVRRAQSLQAQMNLINLENDIRKNYSNFMLTTYKYEKEVLIQNSTNIEQFKVEKETATELYFSSADKLATLITSDFVTQQLKEKNWKVEYLTDFKKAERLYKVERLTNVGFTIKIEQLSGLIEKWEKELERLSILKKLYTTYLVWTNKPINTTNRQ